MDERKEYEDAWLEAISRVAFSIVHGDERPNESSTQ